MSLLDDLAAKKAAAGNGVSLPKAGAAGPSSDKIIPENADGNVNNSQKQNKPAVENAVPAVEVFTYATTQSEGFGVQLESETVRAKDGVMKLNKAQHTELQALIKTGRPDIAQNLVLLDLDAANEIAEAHRLRHKKSEASKGSVGSGGAFREITQEEGGPGMLALQQRQAAQAENLRNLAPVEEGVTHADDLKVDPNGKNADIIPAT